jgi:hypothetical protein
VKTYEALGRAFVLTPRDDVFKNLDKVNSDTEQKITVLEVSIFYNIKIKYKILIDLIYCRILNNIWKEI